MIICFLLQHTVFTGLSIGNIVPDLIVVLVCTIGYQKGKVEGIFAGIAGGLLLDFQFGSIIGVYALIYMFIGYFCGFLAPYYVRSDTMLPLALTAASEFVFSFYSYIVNIVFKIDSEFEFFFYLRRVMLPKVAYTAVLGIFLYKIFDYIYITVLMDKEEEE